MKLSEFKEKLIEHETRICWVAYKDEPEKRAGCLAGLVACQGQTITGLAELLDAADAALSAIKRDNARYWEVAMFHAEIVDVCDVMSALLKSTGLPPIIEPTKMGYDKMLALMGGAVPVTFEKKVKLPPPH